MAEFNKDFYNELPSMVCELLDDWIVKYGDREGFKAAWEEYRRHIMETHDIFSQRMPGAFFKDVIGAEK